METMNEGGSTILSKQSLPEDSTNMTLLARLDNVRMLQLTTKIRSPPNHGLSDWDQVLGILRNGKRTEIRKGTTSLYVFLVSTLRGDEYILTLFVGKDQLRYPLFTNSRIFHIINGDQNDFIIQLDTENYWLIWQDKVSDSGLQVHDMANILARLVDYKVYGGTIASHMTLMDSESVDKTLPRLPGKPSETIESPPTPKEEGAQPSFPSGHFEEHLSQSAGTDTLLKLESNPVMSFEDPTVLTQISTVHDEQEEIEAAIASLLRLRTEKVPSAVLSPTVDQDEADSDESDVEPITPAAISESTPAADYLQVHSRKPTTENETEMVIDDSSIPVVQDLTATFEPDANGHDNAEEPENSAHHPTSLILDSTESKYEAASEENIPEAETIDSQIGEQVSMMDNVNTVGDVEEDQTNTTNDNALDSQHLDADTLENAISTEGVDKLVPPSAADETEIPEFVMQNLPRSSDATSTSARNSTYRNSIVVVDDDTGDIVGVVQDDLRMDEPVIDSTEADEDVQQSLAAIEATLKGSLHSQAMSLTSTVFDHGSNEIAIPDDVLLVDKASARQRSASQHSVEPSTATTVYHDAEDSAEWFEDPTRDQERELPARPETSFFPLEGDDDASAVEVDIDNDGHLTITSARSVSSEAIVARPYHLPLLGYVTTFASWISDIIGLTWVLGWKKESKDSSGIQGIHDHQRLHRERMNGRKLSLRYHDDMGRPRKVYLASRGRRSWRRSLHLSSCTEMHLFIKESGAHASPTRAIIC